MKYMITEVTCNNSDYILRVWHDFIETDKSEREIVKMYLDRDWNVNDWADCERATRGSYDIDDDGEVPAQELFDYLWKDKKTRDTIDYCISGDPEHHMIIIKAVGDDFPNFVNR